MLRRKVFQKERNDGESESRAVANKDAFNGFMMTIQRRMLTKDVTRGACKPIITSDGMIYKCWLQQEAELVTYLPQFMTTRKNSKGQSDGLAHVFCSASGIVCSR